jgi:hypothetical protein
LFSLTQPMKRFADPARNFRAMSPSGSAKAKSTLVGRWVGAKAGVGSARMSLGRVLKLGRTGQDPGATKGRARLKAHSPDMRVS